MPQHSHDKNLLWETQSLSIGDEKACDNGIKELGNIPKNQDTCEAPLSSIFEN